MTKTSLHSDAVIVGGGLVGGMMACALARSGLAVVVVDRSAPETWLEDRFDGRASAVALASQRLLQALDVWQAVEGNATPILDIRVSESAEPFFLHYDHREIGDAPFGYMVENRHLRQALYGVLRNTENIRFFAPAAVEKIDRNAARAEIVLQDGKAICTPLLIAADGRGSRLRGEAGIRVTKWRYKQTGIVCTVEHEKPHHNVAHEHFLPVGPFAILPLKGNRSSLVWVESEELAPVIVNLDEDDFLNELGKRFGDFLGKLEVVGPRWSFPLGLQHAHTYLAQRTVLIGDAAHAMHPIAGQGLNLGWRDVAVLTEVIHDARQLGLDYGHATVLEGYERWRRFDNTLMLAMTDGLNRLFSNDITPIRWVRDAGLAAVNRMPPLKKVFMASAMGLAGEVPKLMRGEAL